MTPSATTARCSARPGVSVIEHGAPAPDDEEEIPKGTVHARLITPDDALLEYLADHGLRRISKRLVSSGIVDVVATAIPGIHDSWCWARSSSSNGPAWPTWSLVDAPATGHAVTFLTSASGLLEAARGGPVRAQAADVVELLTDPARCQVLLVTLPEEMPVNEPVEAAYQLEDRVGSPLGPVIVNGCYDRSGGPRHPIRPQAAAGRRGWSSPRNWSVPRPCRRVPTGPTGPAGRARWAA